MKHMLNQTTILTLVILALVGFSGCGDSNSTSNNITHTDAVQTDNIAQTEDNVETDLEVRPQYKPAGWYMKTSVSATDTNGQTYVHDTAGVFGELKQSVDGKDQHDIPVLSGGAITLVFPQAEWDGNNGDYFTDYRANSAEGEKRTWTFQIKSSSTLANAPMVISLEGMYDVMYLEENDRILYKESLGSDQSKKESIRLIDVDNGMTYTYGQLQTVQLNMDGLKTRTFRWVIGQPDASDYEPLETTVSKVTSSEQSKTVQTQSLPQSTSKFGLPPH